MTENLHATAISVGGLGVLLRGKPGSGKSDLALRCLALPEGPLTASIPMLVADDRVIVTRTPAGIRLTCPAALRGLIEVRGIGIVTLPAVESARLALVVDLVAPSAIERLPATCDPAVICGREVPRILLTPFEPSAPLKLMLAMAGLPAA